MEPDPERFGGNAVQPESFGSENDPGMIKYLFNLPLCLLTGCGPDPFETVQRVERELDVDYLP